MEAQEVCVQIRFYYIRSESKFRVQLSRIEESKFSGFYCGQFTCNSSQNHPNVHQTVRDNKLIKLASVVQSQSRTALRFSHYWRNWVRGHQIPFGTLKTSERVTEKKECEDAMKEWRNFSIRRSFASKVSHVCPKSTCTYSKERVLCLSNFQYWKKCSARSLTKPFSRQVQTLFTPT